MTDSLLPQQLGALRRFGLVGLTASGVHAAVLTVLVAVMTVWPPAANLIAFLVAVGVSYVGHRNFTFQSSRPHRTGLPAFAAVASAGAAANFAVFVLFNDLLGVPWGWTFVISLFSVTPIVYLLSRNLAFNEDAAFERPDVKLWAAPFIFFAAAAAMTVLLHYPLPYFDHWDLVTFYAQAVEGHLRFADLFAPHGGHWHATGYMVMLVLARLTHMSHLAEALASLAISLAGGIVLVRLCLDRARSLEAPGAAVWLAGVAAFIWFSLDQASNWFWGWQVAVFLNTTGAVVTVAALSRRTITPPDVALAAMAAAIAVYAFATGLALLPIGFLLILLNPAERRARALAAALWAIFSAAVLTHYYLGVVIPAAGYVAETTPRVLDGQVLADLAAFTLTFVGGAVGRFSDGLPVAAPLIAAAGALWAGWSLRERPNTLAALAPFIAFVLYGLGAAMLTAYGRIGWGTDQALVGRYISFGNFYWLGVLPIIMLAVSHAQGVRSRRGLQVLAGLLVLMKVATVSNVVIDNDVTAESSKVAEAAEQIRAAYPAPAPAALALVATPEQNVQDRVDVLARLRLSLFHDQPPP